jgi:SAM-dependent methyltransferase
MNETTFRALEHAGWVQRAPAYRDLFGRITEQAIDSILGVLPKLEGSRLLDVACGTGELVARAARAGALAEGLDFAASMVEAARAAYPGLRFQEGDAQELPFQDESFDAVTCAFGLMHLEDPDRALAEARRVLRSGGRYSFTVWCTPDQGLDLWGLVLGAVEEHGTLDVGLPEAPPMFRFSDLDESRRSLRAAGFDEPELRVIDLRWRSNDPEQVLQLIYKGVVRAPMILEAQPEGAREHIHRAIVDAAESCRRDGEIELRFPAVLGVAGST